MIGCDNEQCPREWFHLGCTDLREMPAEDDKWYCRDCRPIFAAREGKRGRGEEGAVVEGEVRFREWRELRGLGGMAEMGWMMYGRG